MDDYDVIYIDDDERNARVTDHRLTAPRSPAGRPMPGGGGRTVVVPPSQRPTVIHHGGTRAPASRPQAVVVRQQPAPASRFAGLSTGEIVESAAQILAAIQPLPAPPTSQGHAETDLENLVLYQSALATHAKRDEQLRTLGSLLGRILK